MRKRSSPASNPWETRLGSSARSWNGEATKIPSLSNNPMSLTVGVLVSGQGTNLQAIIDAIEKKRLDASIAVVISDNPDAVALSRADKHRIPREVVLRKKFPDKKAFEGAILKILKDRKVDW